MSSIFRLRKSNEATLEELKNEYLWFAKPELFNEEDANISFFMNNNSTLMNAIDRVFGSSSFVGENAKHVGICCMSKLLPSVNDWKIYPGGRKGIFVEYDKDAIEEFFKQNMAFGNCIRDVEYHSDPLVFEKDNSYNILWKEGPEGKEFKSINGVMYDDKLRDQLFLKMFTRICDRYEDQKESRIILAGRNIPKGFKDKIGYEIEIPNLIKCVHIQPKTPKKFMEKIKNLGLVIKEHTI